MVLTKLLILILVTFIPFFELRLSIPLGILSGKIEFPFGLVVGGFGINWVLVFLVCVIANIILGPLIYLFLNNFVHYFLKFRLFANYYHKTVERTQQKIQPYIRKYGLLGVALFIGIPLPGSGSYTGALGAYLLGLSYKKFILANALGVLIAGILVTTITLTGIGIFSLF